MKKKCIIKKWWDLGETIKEAEKHVKYWHKADRKYNRTYATRQSEEPGR